MLSGRQTLSFLLNTAVIVAIKILDTFSCKMLHQYYFIHPLIDERQRLNRNTPVSIETGVFYAYTKWTFLVEVARVELASKYVNYSATTGLVGCCTLRSAGSRRPALHDFPFGTLWQGTGTTLAFETPIDAPLTDPGMDDPERR